MESSSNTPQQEEQEEHQNDREESLEIQSSSEFEDSQNLENFLQMLQPLPQQQQQLSSPEQQQQILPQLLQSLPQMLQSLPQQQQSLPQLLQALPQLLHSLPQQQQISLQQQLLPIAQLQQSLPQQQPLAQQLQSLPPQISRQLSSLQQNLQQFSLLEQQEQPSLSQQQQTLPQQQAQLPLGQQLQSVKQQQTSLLQQLQSIQQQQQQAQQSLGQQRQRSQEETEEEERLLQGVRELEEELNIEILLQPQQPNHISELTDEQHDELVLYKLHDEEIKKKISTQLRNQIATIVTLMGSSVPRCYKENIKDKEHDNGSHAALKRLLYLGRVKKLNSGWSRQLLQVIINKNYKVAEELIKPKQNDLDDFKEQIGVPRNSLLHQIAEKLRSYCSILVSPMGGNDQDSHDVPVVHPELCVSEDHFRRNTAFTDGTYQPAEETTKAYSEAPRISFNALAKSHEQTPEATNKYELLLRKHHGLFIFLIGPAGSGKTTLTKRMVKTSIEEKKMAFLIPFAQIDQNQRLRLKNLLIKSLCQLHNVEHDPSEEEIDDAFNWILANQEKCILIFDGLDQAGFDISKKQQKADIDDELMPCDLLALILSRKFLPKVRLVLSTRPHSIANLAPATQPQVVVFLNDMLSNDVEKLMNYYLQQGVAIKLMEELQMKSPRIYQLIFNPLFLRLVVMLENETGEDVWSYVNTTAKLFYEVIDRLQTSAHHEYGLGVEDVKVLNDKLANMAYNKTMELSVVFTKADLERYSLNGENIQDFLFGVMQSSSQRNTALLVGLMMVFFFNHQSTQEFFSARFALEKLSVEEFKQFVGKLFPATSYKNIEVGEDMFANLRVLLIGCINELELPISNEILEKKRFFLKSLCDRIRQIFGNNVTIIAFMEHQKRMMTDLLDFREYRVIREIRDNLKDFNFWMNFGFFEVVSHLRESLSHFLQNFTSKVKCLRLTIDDWSENEIRRLFQAVYSSSMKIEKTDIWMKEHHPSVSDLVSTFPHFTNELTLWMGGDVDAHRQFCRNLEEAITNFDRSLLQTENLEVKIMNVSGGNLLHVFLRGGQLSQLSTSDPSVDDISDDSLD